MVFTGLWASCSQPFLNFVSCKMVKRLVKRYIAAGLNVVQLIMAGKWNIDKKNAKVL